MKHGDDKSKGSCSKDECKFKAEIQNMSDNYENLRGWVEVVKEEDSGELKLNYSIRGGPAECSTCKLAIYKGSNCNHIGDPYYDDKNLEENPWTIENGAKYVPNMKGRAASMIKIKNEKPIRKHQCRLVVLFDEEEGEDDKRRHRFLHSSKDNERVVGCGLLIPDGEVSTYCDEEEE